MWKNVIPAPADAILGLTEAFKNDPRAEKVNLGVGVYKDEAGATPVLASVKAAEKKVLVKINPRELTLCTTHEKQESTPTGGMYD